MDLFGRTTSAVLLAVALLGNGCSHGLLQDQVAEGVIEYALSFPDYDPNGLMAGMLPEKTTVTFTQDRQLAELSAGMGVFRTAIVTDNERKQLDYHLSLLSKKLVSRLQPRDMPTFNKEKPALTILYTNEVDTIAGYPCKKAVAVFGAIDKPEIELYYTDRIRIDDPNWYGPFQEVPGVLMRYELVQYGMRMRLDAVAVTPGPVDPVRFALKEGYQEVPPDVLDHELQEVLGTFSL
ncbi:MAG: hypothetical protein GFGODING_00989 [Flavobacteriales bacterium]|nr:hypothetical protein [Flavobacteriales bacterium]